MKKSPLYRFVFAETWMRYLQQYRALAGPRAPLDYPLIGNPVGLRVEQRVIPIDAIKYHYYASEMASLLRGTPHPVVAEIGGGSGGQAYRLIRDLGRPATYLIFDLPEVLVIAAYFLLTALPTSRILLYGEAPWEREAMAGWQVILLPHFTLPRMPEETVDLFFNANSFSEMDSVTAREYLEQVQRTCRKYFLHINHTAALRWPDGAGTTRNVPATELVPDPRLFKRIYQRPRVFWLVSDKVLYRRYRCRHFAFLYERH